MKTTELMAIAGGQVDDELLKRNQDIAARYRRAPGKAWERRKILEFETFRWNPVGKQSHPAKVGRSPISGDQRPSRFENGSLGAEIMPIMRAKKGGIGAMVDD